jgi:hypothetical protein
VSTKVSAVSAPTPSTWRKRSVFGVVLLADHLQLTLIVSRIRSVREPIVSKMGPRAGQSAPPVCVRASFLVEASRWALGQPSTEGFHRPSNVVDQLRAATDQRLARADDG